MVVLGSFYGLSHRDVVAYRLTPVVSDEARSAALRARGRRSPCQRWPSTSKSTPACRASASRSESPRRIPLDALSDARRSSWRALHAPGRSGRRGSGTEREAARATRRGAFRSSSATTFVHRSCTWPTSAGMMRFPASRRQLVRPGLALYYFVGGHFVGATSAGATRSSAGATHRAASGSAAAVTSRGAARSLAREQGLVRRSF